jgi:sulfotransferase family protein
MILSEKSSGSSACQYVLTSTRLVQSVSKTRHYENETLYWTKAASILGLPQLPAVDSEVPLKPERARLDLLQLLKDNLDGFEPPKNDRQLIFEGWRALCEKFSPVFLEKSPHHLYQWSAIELMLECLQSMPDIEFLVIGLVRNPMDTIYSQFARWRTRPETLEQQWLVAYSNLRKLQPLLGEKLFVLRYEDMVSALDSMNEVFDFCGLNAGIPISYNLHKNSISKWKTDRMFGFSLSDEVIELARGYGYSEDDIVNNNRSSVWVPYRELTRLAYRSASPVRSILRRSAKVLAD